MLSRFSRLASREAVSSMRRPPSLSRRRLASTPTTPIQRTYFPGTMVERAVKIVGITYSLLMTIPVTLSGISAKCYFVDGNSEKARAYAFFAWTGYLSIPLSMALFLFSPISLLTDGVDRRLLNHVQIAWASLSLYPFLEETEGNEERLFGLGRDASIDESSAETPTRQTNKNEISIEYPPSGPVRGKCIIVSNHLSFLDPYVIFETFSDGEVPIRFVSKREIFFIPLVGWVMGLIGHLALRREDKSSGRTVLEQCETLLNSSDRAGIVFFAEGSRARKKRKSDERTSSSDVVLGEFKMGAFNLAKRTRTKIVPLTIIGTDEAMGPGKELEEFRTEAKIRVVVHEPIEFDPNLSAEETRDKVRGVILNELMKSARAQDE